MRSHLCACLALAALLMLALSSCQLPQALTPPPAPVVSAKGISVPVKVDRAVDGSTLVIITISINGQGAYPFALDTGASVSLIDHTIADRLKLPHDGQSEQVSGVGGTQLVQPVKVRQWSAGQIRLPTTTLASASVPNIQKDTGIVGLLGSDVLSRFGAFTLDYSRSTFTVYTQVADAPRQMAAAPLA